MDAARAAARVWQAVVFCGDENALRNIGGLTLFERLLRQLCELPAIERIVVLAPASLSTLSPSSRIRKPVTHRTVSSREFWQALREARADLDETFIAVAADHLIDERLIAWLTSQAGDAMLVARSGGDAGPAARLSREALDHPDARAANLALVPAGSLPSYWEAMHGDVPLHLHRVASDADAEAGWRILLDHIQRRAQDLPSRYFDPMLEGPLVRWLAGTRITANQVTIFTTIVGFAVAALFYLGWLRTGAIVGVAVEVLDGVDGKLARITRTTSRAGELEHVLDFFYENSWYAALGLYLSRIGFAHAMTAAVLMILFDLADTLIYAAVDVRWRRSLDNLHPFLTRFRLVAGRRNIYGWIFLAGFFLGLPAPAFYLATAWAGITAATHAAWMIRAGFARRRVVLSRA